ncbi:MAG: asparagine synthase (glutamine-hydrolyzing) [Ectothiorhodospiraceae bacterium]|nr:asparagine synthase (glutamine-hydrolyzing) [Ectothiorhodospiraceae bacterium]
MCGIAGYYSQHPARMLPGGVQRVADALRHRGPDFNDDWQSESGTLFLFHARLSIQDLSPAGNQPMCSRSGRYRIVFNGEIYNFREIRADLSRRGIPLRGHSDTEVLLEAIDCYGLEQALQRAEGMFAFAVHDALERMLYLARDRLGEKPLYYFYQPGTFAFGSELSALRAMTGALGELDQDAIALYLKYGYFPEPVSVYRAVRKLPPGTMLRFPVDDARPLPSEQVTDLAARAVQPYWTLDACRARAESEPYSRFDDAVTGVHQALKSAVERQSVADVDVGAFLSGGIDSTLVTALYQHQASRPIRSFTIAFEDPSFNEAGFAREIARHLGTEHREIRIQDRELLDLVEDLPRHYSEPHANPSQLPALLLSKYTREHVTVSLAGDGGDELFCGYNRYLWGARVARLNARLPRALRRLVAAVLAAGAGTAPTLHSLTRGRGKGPVQNIDQKLRKLADVLRLEGGEAVYDYLLSTGSGVAEGPAPITATRELDWGAERFIASAMMLDQLTYLPGDNLAKLDRATMAYSLEARLPLLDLPVLEQAWRVPQEFHTRNGASKAILREILYQYVPRHLIERPKMGFTVPIAAWIDGPLRDLIQDSVSSDLVNTLACTTEESRPLGSRGHGLSPLAVWALFVLANWIRALEDFS